MAERAHALDDWYVQRGVLATIAAATLATTGAAADGASRASVSFRLVFDGMHTAALMHEGPFTTSAAFCAAGHAADLRIEADTETAVRRFSCSGSSDEFTARVKPVPAEHGGNGSWQIVDGAGALTNLRGKGTWTSVRLSGTDGDPRTITYRSTWQGVVDFDASAPAISVSKSSAKKLRRPKGAFQLSFALAFDEAAGNVVSYELTVIDPRTALRVTRFGDTSTGRATAALRVRPTKRTRILRVVVEATDPFGNTAQLATTRRIR